MILASGSPRRQELIKMICDAYTVITADIDEIPVPGEKPTELVYRLAYLKAKKVFEETADKANRIVIGADTIVALGDKILGKPVDRADASRMLHDLSGSPGLAHLFDAQKHPLSRHRVGKKYGAALHLGNTLTLSGIVGNGGFVNLVFDEHR
jgi:hypothetical protein